MKVKIAAFGSEEVINRLKQITLNREDLEILPFIYERAEEIPDLIEKVFTCDFYLFTNPIASLYAKEKVDKKRLPVIQVEYDPYTLASSLYQLHTETNKSLEKVAMDVISPGYIQEIESRLQLKQQSISYYPFDLSGSPDLTEPLSFYEDLWEKGEIDYVLTSLNEIVNALKVKNIPARKITPPDYNLLKAVEKGIALTKLNQTQNTQIVTGKIAVKGLEAIAEKSGKKKKEILNALSEVMNRFIKRTDSMLIRDTEETFIVVGTDKLLKHLKKQYREFPLLQDLKANVELPIHMGFGLGLHAKAAKANALLALESCRHSKHSICYIVNERQEVIGPIGIKKEIDTSSLYQALIHDARLNNELSYNFIDFITERNNEPFSTNDIALFYQVTKRSAERTVNKLLSGAVIKISGEERPYTKGRPRKLFTLDQ